MNPSKARDASNWTVRSHKLGAWTRNSLIRAALPAQCVAILRPNVSIYLQLFTTVLTCSCSVCWPCRRTFWSARTACAPDGLALSRPEGRSSSAPPAPSPASRPILSGRWAVEKAALRRIETVKITASPFIGLLLLYCCGGAALVNFCNSH